VPPLVAFRPDIPKELQSIQDLSLARNPDERFPTAQAFRVALETFLKRLGKPIRLAAWLQDLATRAKAFDPSGTAGTLASQPATGKPVTQAEKDGTTARIPRK
jgi:hypothetical protein